MTATDAAAWWGAIAATSAVIWDFFKWFKGGPHLELEAVPNMVVMSALGLNDDKRKYILVRATNVGDQKTTITHLAGVFYPGRLDSFRDINGSHFVVTTPVLSAVPLPHVLGPGEVWSGGLNQTDELVNQSRDGFLYVGVFHAMAKKPVMSRIRILPKADQKLSEG